MILDFAKKHWKIIYSLFLADFIAILIINKFICHDSVKIPIKLFIFMMFFWSLVYIILFSEIVEKIFLRIFFRKNKEKDDKEKRTGFNKEGSSLLFLCGSIYASIMFFINPIENNYLGYAPFMWLPENICTILFAKIFNISGSWFKKDDGE